VALKFIITASVADLRREPELFSSKDYSHQDLRETQLLFGERLELLDTKEEWIHVAALEQIYFDEAHGWTPHHGWILSSEAEEVDSFPASEFAVFAPTISYKNVTLSFGTLLNEAHPLARPLPKVPNRSVLVEDALQFVGMPYLWGGRAFHLGSPISSVDCSGLINLIYRAQGVTIPRNAYDQYLKCLPTARLKPGDPLYLAREKKVNHVVLKLDDQTFMEAPKTGQKVRLLKWETEIWEDKGRIHIFDRDYSYMPYPGAFITS
jgi:hypothetical protein